jgi:predicted permease
MIEIVAATLPFFAVIALGMVAGFRGMIPISAVRPINTFCFYYAMPALIGRALWRMEVGDLLDLRVLLGWLAAGLTVYAIGAGLVTLAAGGDGGRAAIRGQASAIGNIGFLGVPVVLGVFGEAGAGPVAMALMVDLVVLIPMTIAWLEVRRSQGSAMQAAGRALGRSVTNPFFLSILMGAGLSALAVPLPPILDRTLEFLGGAASPTALFSLGLYLAGNLRVQRPVEASTIGAIKLFLHPALLWAILGPGLGVEGPLLAAAVVMAAMPVASNVFVIAEAYDTAPKLAADAVTLSTLASVVTLSVLLGVVG